MVVAVGGLGRSGASDDGVSGWRENRAAEEDREGGGGGNGATTHTS